MDPEVDVVLVHWRNVEATRKCIASLARVDFAAFRVIVCVNGSGDRSAVEQVVREFLGQIDDRPADRSEVEAVSAGLTEQRMGTRVVLVEASINRGYAAGVNAALLAASKSACPRYYWILNSDVEVSPRSLPALVAKMSAEQDIGMCAVTFRTENSEAPGLLRLGRWTGRVRRFTARRPRRAGAGEGDLAARAHAVHGAAVFVRADLLEGVGIMDERYFLYYEEIDWGLRVRRAGQRLGYCQDAYVRHGEGRSMGMVSANRVSDVVRYYASRSAVLLAMGQKTPPVLSVVAYRVAASLGLAVSGRFFGAGHTLSGVYDALVERCRSIEDFEKGSAQGRPPVPAKGGHE